MTLKYVWKNFRRRKVRTALMMLSLMVSTGLIVALNATVETIRRSNIDLIATEAGRFDMAISKTDISPDPFILIDQTAQTARAADPHVEEIFPRFQSIIELESNGKRSSGWLVALDPKTDTVGRVEVIDGTYDLAGGQAAVFQATAETFDLKIGDNIEVAFVLPLPREPGKTGSAGASSRRALREFVVGAVVRLEGVTSWGLKDGLLLDLGLTQEWLGLPGRAGQLLGTVQTQDEGRDSHDEWLSPQEASGPEAPRDEDAVGREIGGEEGAK